MSIKLRSVTKVCKGKELVSKVNFDAKNGEFIVVKGNVEEAGMLFDILHGVEKASSGSIVNSGYDITSKKRRECENLYRTVFGIVSQDFQNDLSVADNISLPGFFANISKIEQKRRTETMAKNLGIFEILKRKPKGLKKDIFVKVMIARACYMNPKIILASEPTKGLKDDDAKVLLSLLKNFAKKNQAIVIIASNDNAVEKFATRILTFAEGRLA